VDVGRAPPIKMAVIDHLLETYEGETLYKLVLGAWLSPSTTSHTFQNRSTSHYKVIEPEV